MELRIKNGPTKRPSESVDGVCERVLGLERNTLLLKVEEPDHEDPPEIRDIPASDSDEASSDEESGLDEATGGATDPEM